jgi:hypothetical protein
MTEINVAQEHRILMRISNLESSIQNVTLALLLTDGVIISLTEVGDTKLG